ncbi:MAG TPA: hypothetical protein VFS17_02535 [Methylophilaceae bacterium]|nr:hypothetical protein [Methylophilaceae bacterium]
MNIEEVGGAEAYAQKQISKGPLLDAFDCSGMQSRQNQEPGEHEGQDGKQDEYGVEI